MQIEVTCTCNPKKPLAAREGSAVSMVWMMFNFYHNVAFSNFITSLEIYCLHLKKKNGSEIVKEKSQYMIRSLRPGFLNDIGTSTRYRGRAQHKNKRERKQIKTFFFLCLLLRLCKVSDRLPSCFTVLRRYGG